MYIFVINNICMQSEAISDILVFKILGAFCYFWGPLDADPFWSTPVAA